MGGNVFENSSSIKLENIEFTIKKYFEELSRIFPNNKSFSKDKFKITGSVGKKEVSGDIDFAIDTSTIMDDYLEKWGIYKGDIDYRFSIFEKRARTATKEELLQRAVLDSIVAKINNNVYTEIQCDQTKVTAGNIFTLTPQYDSTGNKTGEFAQIDWMIGPIEWLEFSYYSDVYEGNVKGLHRTQLVLAMFNNLGLSFNHTKGVSNLKTKEVLATTPKEALKILEEGYGVQITYDLLKNYFSLCDVVLHSIAVSDRNNVLDIYMKILDRTRCDVPENLQKYYVNNKVRLQLTGKFLPEDSKVKEDIKEKTKEEDEAV